MPSCDRCGGDVSNKNAAGHYRDKCRDCMQAIADEREPVGREAIWDLIDDADDD